MPKCLPECLPLEIHHETRPNVGQTYRFFQYTVYTIHGFHVAFVFFTFFRHVLVGLNYVSCNKQILIDPVDRRNPAPPGMYKTLSIMGYLPYQLVQDFSINSRIHGINNFTRMINVFVCLLHVKKTQL